MALNTKAGQYAESFGLQENAMVGHGREFNDNLLNTAFKRIAGTGVEDNLQMGTRVINSGMQFSGVGQSKVPGAVTNKMAGEAFGAMNEVAAENERFRLDSSRRWLDILKHEDNYDFQQQQLEAQEGDFLDVIGRIGSIVSMIP